MLQRECINKQESQILKELEVWPGTLEPVAETVTCDSSASPCLTLLLPARTEVKWDKLIGSTTFQDCMQVAICARELCPHRTLHSKDAVFCLDLHVAKILKDSYDICTK